MIFNIFWWHGRQEGPLLKVEGVQSSRSVTLPEDLALMYSKNNLSPRAIIDRIIMKYNQSFKLIGCSNDFARRNCSNDQLLSFELNMNSFDFWPGKVCPARQYFAPQSVWSRPKFMGKDDCVDESNYFPAPWYDLVRDLTRLMDVKVHKSRECQGAYNIGSFVWQGSTIIDILVSCFFAASYRAWALRPLFSAFWCLGQNLPHIDIFYMKKFTNCTSNSVFF